MSGVTPTSICNLALDAVPASRIVSLSENSFLADVVRPQYHQVISEMLETHTWKFQRTVLALAELPANDRATEWGNAYALPSDLGIPVRVMQVRSGGVGYSAYAEQPWFDIIGGTLYCHVNEAALDYVSTVAIPDQFTAMFIRAAALKIAAQIAMPITKDRRRKADLLAEAELIEQRAQAGNINNNPNDYGDFIPDAIRERFGVMSPELGAGDPLSGGDQGQSGDIDMIAIFNNAYNT